MGGGPRGNPLRHAGTHYVDIVALSLVPAQLLHHHRAGKAVDERGEIAAQPAELPIVHTAVEMGEQPLLGTLVGAQAQLVGHQYGQMADKAQDERGQTVGERDELQERVFGGQRPVEIENCYAAAVHSHCFRYR